MQHTSFLVHQVFSHTAWLLEGNTQLCRDWPSHELWSKIQKTGLSLGTRGSVCVQCWVVGERKGRSHQDLRPHGLQNLTLNVSRRSHIGTKTPMLSRLSETLSYPLIFLSIQNCICCSEVYSYPVRKTSLNRRLQQSKRQCHHLPCHSFR